MGGVLDDTNSGINNALNTPAFNLGVGLLSAAGPSENPVSLGQALGRGVQFAQNAQQQALRNQLVRSRLEDDARKRNVTEQLGGLLGGGSDPTLGLLAQVAPNAVAQSLVGQRFPRQNSVIQQAQFAFPDDPVKQREFVAELAGLSPVDRAKLRQIEQGTQIEAQERAENVATTKQERAAQDANITFNIDRFIKANVANQTRGQSAVSGTGIDAILPAGFGRAARVLGAPDIPKQIEAETEFTRIGKELVISGGLTPLMGIKNLTDTARRQLSEAKFDENTPAANAQIAIASGLEGLLTAVDIRGIKISPEKRKQINDIIRRSKGQSPKDNTRLGPETAPPPELEEGGQRVFNVRPPVSQRRVGDIFNHPQAGAVEWTGRGWRKVN